MRLSTALVLFMGAQHTQVLAQSNTNPPCIEKCLTPISSWCDGDETGAALDQCRCSTYLGSTNRFTCIKACLAADQAVYAGTLPELCRDDLLPGVTPSTTATSRGGANTTPSTSSSGGLGVAMTTTSGGGAAQTSVSGVARRYTRSGFLAVWGLLGAVLFL